MLESVQRKVMKVTALAGKSAECPCGCVKGKEYCLGREGQSRAKDITCAFNLRELAVIIASGLLRQSPTLSMALLIHQNHVPKYHIHIWNISRDGNSIAFLGSLFQCLNFLVNKLPNIQFQPFLQFQPSCPIACYLGKGTSTLLQPPFTKLQSGKFPLLQAKHTQPPRSLQNFCSRLCSSFASNRQLSCQYRSNVCTRKI